MPRPARQDVPGYPRHLCIRGVNGMPFFTGDMDRHVFLKYVREAVADSGDDFALHAFVLMTNHVHMLATGKRKGVVPAIMQRIGTRYARYFNTTHKRTGPLFGSRYWASLIETERYLFATMRYIELNAVRAGIVDDPALYPWSSYRHNAGLGWREEITFHETFLGMGTTPEHRARAWASLVAEATAPMELAHIRKQLAHGHPLGGPEFIARFGKGRK